MKWLYYFPHAWDGPRTCWEDVWLRPDDPDLPGLAYFITVESFADLAAHDDAESVAELERLRADVGATMWVEPYDGSARRLQVRVRAEDFTGEELVEWTRQFLLSRGREVDALEEMGDAEVRRCQRYVYGEPGGPTVECP
jgi:hypothetical protein